MQSSHEIVVNPYSPSLANPWNTFVSDAKNGLFLFHRDYLEYHQDRFIDHSLTFWQDDDLLALLPANEKDGVLYSHQGLTFGGLVTNEKMRAPLMLSCFESLINYCQKKAIKEVIYKAVPPIYHTAASQEDLYALFRNQAKLSSCLVTTCIDMRNPLHYSQRRKRGIKKARKAQVDIQRSSDFEGYFKILTSTLREKHGALPTHTLVEILRLKERFPDHIHLFGAFQHSNMEAGVIIYESKHVAHCQYIASTDPGKEIGALDLLFDHLITKVYPHKRHFDFGSSNEEGGRILNEGLITQKEEFGGRAVVQPIYSLAIPSPK